ncbi:hypothetical protein AVEN_231544-1 [Araneus ventricosus]|uniref:Uncharacterized protein n=1 Tax=Araneus ventricosus TaxID=182803 RepID=A0A4Y1ZL13_ARAVE|nr:hypothetical protein AVEN_231544-1 [Araneus ventricosus]
MTSLTNGEKTSEQLVCIVLGWKSGEMQMLPAHSAVRWFICFCFPMARMDNILWSRHAKTSSTKWSNTTQLQFCHYQSAIREHFCILNVSKLLSPISEPLSTEVSLNTARK